ncbi:MAG: acetylglutamate kinase [Oligoflexia bacterium]|nr:acetylglutamate kinase [Oligoflexia bacterium]MBF0367345.1 acetylglutamate kinase [Oligoflexia bacterium]
MSNITVIKFGGEIIDSLDQLDNLAIAIKSLYEQGQHVVLVHGGGPQASKLSTRLGLSPKMVGGRRVTDAETLEVMKMTLPGIVNSNILSILKKHHLPGASVSGISVVNAKKRPPKAVTGSNGEVVDFGFVGDIINIDTTIIHHLLSGRFIPVVGPLSADDQGQVLNINADTVAVKIAKKLQAQKFVAVTQVGGVFQNLEDKNSRFAMLTLQEAKQKIADGVIKGGMIPKLEEGFELLQDQLDSFHIVGLDSADGLLSELTKPGSIGTAIVRI